MKTWKLKILLLNLKVSWNKWKALSKRIQPLNDKFEKDYTVLEIIGNGNFGQVFKCKRNLPNEEEKLYAVKKSKLQFISYKDRVAKEEEIRKWQIITNNTKNMPREDSHCIDLYEAWEENGYIFSSSEYWENGNLAEYLKKLKDKLKKKDIYSYISDMAKAIKQVHEWGIIHMDIKPDNFLVKGDLKIKLADFGLAINFDNSEEENGNANIPKRNKLIDISEGDASYLAPELLNFNPKVSPKIDVFRYVWVREIYSL